MSIFTHRRSQASMKRFYNRIFRIYSRIEMFLDPILDAVVTAKIASIPGVDKMTALDYACGSGALTLKLAAHFQTVIGRDQSSAMLDTARTKTVENGLNIRFSLGDLLAIDEPENSVDWVFVSFALHLFPPDKEIEILGKLLSVSRRGVMIIDHNRHWSFRNAMAEWLEGSYYDQFITTDFRQMADRIGAASFEEAEIGDAMVLTFGAGETKT